MKQAVAGTLESGDIMVTIGPGEGLQVDLQSSVAAQFGRQIKAVITETLEGLGIKMPTWKPWTREHSIVPSGRGLPPLPSGQQGKTYGKTKENHDVRSR